MKQYIIIILALLAGRYLEIPLWQLVLFGAGLYWINNMIEEVNKGEEI